MYGLYSREKKNGKYFDTLVDDNEYIKPLKEVMRYLIGDNSRERTLIIKNKETGEEIYLLCNNNKEKKED